MHVDGQCDAFSLHLRWPALSKPTASNNPGKFACPTYFSSDGAILLSTNQNRCIALVSALNELLELGQLFLKTAKPAGNNPANQTAS